MLWVFVGDLNKVNDFPFSHCSQTTQRGQLQQHFRWFPYFRFFRKPSSGTRLLCLFSADKLAEERESGELSQAAGFATTCGSSSSSLADTLICDKSTAATFKLTDIKLGYYFFSLQPEMEKRNWK